MFRGWIKRWSTSSMLNEMERYLRFLRAGSDEEVAFVLVCAALTRETLRNASFTHRPFPSEALDGTVIIDKTVRTELLAFSVELGSVHKRCTATDSQATAIMASGIVVWRMSVRAITVSELFAPGREIWAELRRGTSHAVVAFDDVREMAALGARPMPELWFPRALSQESATPKTASIKGPHIAPDAHRDDLPLANTIGPVEDAVIDASMAAAARPFLQNAARFLNWDPAMAGRAWALSVTAGLAARMCERATGPIGVTRDSAKGLDLIAIDLCLLCVCDALSQRTGTMFEFTTLVAFTPSTEAVGRSATVEDAIQRSKARQEIAADLFNRWSSDQELLACFRAIGISAIRFYKEPAERHLTSIQSAFVQLQGLVESRLSSKGRQA